MQSKEFDEGFEYGFVTALSRALSAVNNIDNSDGKLNALGMRMLVIEQLNKLQKDGYVTKN